MNIEFNPTNFLVNENGELEFHGQVITIHNEFRYMSKEQKLDILIMLVNWANDEIKKSQ
jgi:hypothetical protein